MDLERNSPGTQDAGNTASQPIPRMAAQTPEHRVSTGIEGLDVILGGGLTQHRLYLVEGTPGAGKTTMALQFLLDGAARGDNALYITLSETRVELLAVAAGPGWNWARPSGTSLAR
jgi:circadian clock protein KaiC